MLRVLIPHAAILATIGLFLAIALPLKWWRTRTRRRSPMTFSVRHFPGERARSQIAALEESFGDNVAMLTMLGPAFVAVWLASRVDLSDVRFTAFDATLLVALIGFIAYSATRVHRNAERRRQLSDGLYAELATAQELTPLYAKGYHIVHNVAGDGFDIDHVVIGPSCVWTIESKSRRKPKGGGKEAATVTVDGRRQGIALPDWIETRPLAQARAGAQPPRPVAWRAPPTRIDDLRCLAGMAALIAQP